MITLNAFLSAVQENVNRITHYEMGGDGKGGGCDCIGLIIGAVRLAGGSWPGTHGSNWAARNAMDGLGNILDTSDLFLGEIVYKAKVPGDTGYALPPAYDDSTDRRDYYHVGVVTGISPLCITHCTSVSGGIQVDDRQGLWQYGGKLRYVDYGAEDEPLYLALVTAPSGKTVNLRSGPGMNNKVIAQVPIGETVAVYGAQDDWCKVEWQGKAGWMMRKFLQIKEECPFPDIKNELESIRDCLKEALQTVERLLNGGM